MKTTHATTRRPWTFYRAHAPDFAALSGPLTAPAETPAEIMYQADATRHLVRATIAGAPAWSYMYAVDLEPAQGELAL